MNPPNPLTIDWLRDNAKPGETVLVDAKMDEYTLMYIGKGILVINDESHEYATWKAQDYKIKQPAKPRACAFLRSDADNGEVRFFTGEHLKDRVEIRDARGCWSRAHQYDIEPRE